MHNNDGKGTTAAESTTVPADLTRFVSALFAPTDKVLVRPIESWVAGEKKCARVLYKATRHIQASFLGGKPFLWGKLLAIAEAEHANLFFGACPRFGGNSNFDLAWQIRTVRALWSDLDHCPADEALSRCEATGLPRPSVIVPSGHGVHLYWLLVEPVLIDDVGRPPAVFKEFGAKGERPRQYILGPKRERIYEYLDEGRSKQKNPAWPTPSPKALHVQDVVAGIAAKIGGDHTQDLARLLRLPCTLNRKDERNGKPPVLCELVECDPERRYVFADFERFAEAAPEQVRVKESKKVRLPKGKKLTANRLNKLGDFINVCAVADDRSKADFHLCAWAMEEGLDKEEVWREVSDVG